MGNGGMLWGRERMRCPKVMLLSLSVDGAMVRLPLVCWDKGSRLVREQEIVLDIDRWLLDNGCI